MAKGKTSCFQDKQLMGLLHVPQKQGLGEGTWPRASPLALRVCFDGGFLKGYGEAKDEEASRELGKYLQTTGASYGWSPGDASQSFTPGCVSPYPLGAPLIRDAQRRGRKGHLLTISRYGRSPTAITERAETYNRFFSSRSSSTATSLTMLKKCPDE